MNCLEFRRIVLADPRRQGAEAGVHAGQCPACREFLARSLEAEARLASVLQIAVPKGLRARLLDRAAGARRSMRVLALAASVLAAVAIGLALGWTRNDPVALAGIDFVVFEEAQAIADAKPADAKVLARVVREMGVALPAQLGEIRYVGTCPFAGSTAHHVLVKTPLGKVTLLLTPERPLASRAVASARGLEAAIMPVSAGSVAIIAESARSIVRAETLLRSG